MQLIQIKRPDSPVSINHLNILYTEYLQVLRPYSKELQKNSTKEAFQKIASEEIEKTLGSDNTDLFVFNDDHAYIDPIGFAIVGHYPNAYSEDDIYIKEFYITRRKQGFGREAVRLVLQHYNSLIPLRIMDVSLYVLEENFPARLFWKNVMQDLGYKDLTKEEKAPLLDKKRFTIPGADLKFEYWHKQVS